MNACWLSLSNAPAGILQQLIQDNCSYLLVLIITQAICCIFSAKTKRCRIDLLKRHRFAIAKLQVPTAELATSRPRANFSQQSLAAGSIRNTQNAALQLNETTSLHFFDRFPKPAAGHSKLTHLLIQQSSPQNIDHHVSLSRTLSR
ncbi:Alkylated DNA repair protein alkB-like protein [Dorcoceras hygrometricum]|uniref:Alkylated DNA repair protein alkB-like protein n=1 Tax=Dorcoceras hygrometricum TaxID=472368 RepID=A0A2Z7CWX9_9LAMI|nr:Alkylated DNA repair protein alkB-like protein [Dorcoceras hygrometricum]